MYKSLCRNCGCHAGMVDDNGFCIESKFENKWARCNCPLYEPSDNLEYLEYKANEQQ